MGGHQGHCWSLLLSAHRLLGCEGPQSYLTRASPHLPSVGMTEAGRTMFSQATSPTLRALVLETRVPIR